MSVFRRKHRSTGGGLVFLSWTPEHGRSSGLAEALDATPVFVGDRNYEPRSALRRYLVNSRTTWRALEQAQPRGVIVMLPPLPALVVTMWWARRHHASVALDAHTGVFNDPKWRWALPATLRLARRARVTIVTNEALARQVRRSGAAALVLHNAPEKQAADGRGGGGVVIPCSWAADEPVEHMLAATRALGITTTVTGRPRADVAARHPHATFTGYLPAKEYQALLEAADVVLAMTTREHTMQQAGYEALSRHLPLVTSDTAVLREYFPQGAVFAAADTGSIERALRDAWARRVQLREEMRDLHHRRLQEWMHDLARLRTTLGD